MTTNVFFSKGTKNEQFLYQDLLIEAIRQKGHDCYYLPRTLVNEDELFGEDPLSSFSDAYVLEMWMETQEGYEGEKELVSKFGLEIRDETIFVVARRRWDSIVSLDNNLITSLRPAEGDLIYMPTVKKLFEISFVDHDDPFYQLDNLPVYKLYSRTFEYSSERFSTGISEIDSVGTDKSLDHLTWQIIGESSGTYNERVALEKGTDIYSDGNIILETGDYLIGEDETGFEFIVLENTNNYDSYYLINESYNIEVLDKHSDNTWLDNVDEDVLDWTERDPFSGS